MKCQIFALCRNKATTTMAISSADEGLRDVPACERCKAKLESLMPKPQYRFEVWHAKNPTFDKYTRFDEPENPNRRRQRFPQDYQKVAVVQAENVDHVFDLTNSKDSCWTKRRNVVELPCGDHQRSTSVGDVVVTPEGKNMYCEMVGWKEIDKE